VEIQLYKTYYASVQKQQERLLKKTSMEMLDKWPDFRVIMKSLGTDIGQLCGLPITLLADPLFTSE
jgi:hypothetical protein